MTRVAIQGIDGSYSSEAARQLVPEASLVECRDFEETFSAVRHGRADCAVVPVANRIVGEIRRTTALLDDSEFGVKDRLDLKIEHVLAGTAGSSFENILRVRSHVEALKQCNRFLSQNLSLTRVVGSDTATSIRHVITENDPTMAAIGSRRAVELYGAKILREDIADEQENWTTFYLIGS